MERYNESVKVFQFLGYSAMYSVQQRTFRGGTYHLHSQVENHGDTFIRNVNSYTYYIQEYGHFQIHLRENLKFYTFCVVIFSRGAILTGCFYFSVCPLI